MVIIKSCSPSDTILRKENGFENTDNGNMPNNLDVAETSDLAADAFSAKFLRKITAEEIKEVSFDDNLILYSAKSGKKLGHFDVSVKPEDYLGDESDSFRVTASCRGLVEGVDCGSTIDALISAGGLTTIYQKLDEFLEVIRNSDSSINVQQTEQNPAADPVTKHFHLTSEQAKGFVSEGASLLLMKLLAKTLNDAPLRFLGFAELGICSINWAPAKLHNCDQGSSDVKNFDDTVLLQRQIHIDTEQTESWEFLLSRNGRLKRWEHKNSPVYMKVASKKEIEVKLVRQDVLVDRNSMAEAERSASPDYGGLNSLFADLQSDNTSINGIQCSDTENINDMTDNDGINSQELLNQKVMDFYQDCNPDEISPIDDHSTKSSIGYMKVENQDRSSDHDVISVCKPENNSETEPENDPDLNQSNSTTSSFGMFALFKAEEQIDVSESQCLNLSDKTASAKMNTFSNFAGLTDDYLQNEVVKSVDNVLALSEKPEKLDVDEYKRVKLNQQHDDEDGEALSESSSSLHSCGLSWLFHDRQSPTSSSDYRVSENCSVVCDKNDDTVNNFTPQKSVKEIDNMLVDNTDATESQNNTNSDSPAALPVVTCSQQITRPPKIRIPLPLGFWDNKRGTNKDQGKQLLIDAPFGNTGYPFGDTSSVVNLPSFQTSDSKHNFAFGFDDSKPSFFSQIDWNQPPTFNFGKPVDKTTTSLLASETPFQLTVDKNKRDTGFQFGSYQLKDQKCMDGLQKRVLKNMSLKEQKKLTGSSDKPLDSKIGDALVELNNMMQPEHSGLIPFAENEQGFNKAGLSLSSDSNPTSMLGNNHPNSLMEFPSLNDSGPPAENNDVLANNGNQNDETLERNTRSVDEGVESGPSSSASEASTGQKWDADIIQKRYKAVKESVAEDIQNYLDGHQEIVPVITDFVQCLLSSKPQDIISYAVAYFQIQQMKKSNHFNN